MGASGWVRTCERDYREHAAFRARSLCMSVALIPSTHGSFLIRRQRGHPGFVLPLVMPNSANH